MRSISAFLVSLAVIALLAACASTKSSRTLEIARAELENNWTGAPVELIGGDSSHGLKTNGYAIEQTGSEIKIYSSDDLGALYGVYALLRDSSLGKDSLYVSNPAYGLRILNHWDNLDGTVERGYAGKSLWKWEQLPDSVSPRYEEYARANAATGINGTVLNNVNASPKILSAEYLPKVAKLADIFRPYGIRVYLSVNFASPMVLCLLYTSDAADEL